jgi:FkbM family methyltransferase
MGFKHRVGATVSLAIEEILSCQSFPLTRYFPRGINWTYDIQRFAGTRNFQVIFDIGANIGQTVYGLLKFFPRADIYCFEPVTSSFGELSASYGDCAKCFKMAMGSVPAQKEIKLRHFSEMDSFLSRDPDPSHYSGKSEIVQISTVDIFCAEHGISSLDVLKMDVQGWELEVLRGADKMLAANRVRYIFTEIGFDRDDTEMVPFGDLDKAISRHGFLFCGFYHFFRHGPMKEFVSFGNALYLNPNFR